MHKQVIVKTLFMSLFYATLAGSLAASNTIPNQAPNPTPLSPAPNSQSKNIGTPGDVAFYAACSALNFDTDGTTTSEELDLDNDGMILDDAAIAKLQDETAQKNLRLQRFATYLKNVHTAFLATLDEACDILDFLDDNPIITRAKRNQKDAQLKLAAEKLKKLATILEVYLGPDLQKSSVDESR